MCAYKDINMSVPRGSQSISVIHKERATEDASFLVALRIHFFRIIFQNHLNEEPDLWLFVKKLPVSFLEQEIGPVLFFGLLCGDLSVFVASLTYILS